MRRRWTDLAATPVPGIEGVVSDPVISPDGLEVAYFAGGALRVTPLAGGVSRTLATDANCCARGGNAHWRISPDGRPVVVRDLREPGGDLWIKELGGGPLSRLTFHPGQDYAGEWTASGDTIVYASDRAQEGRRDVWARRADGLGEPALLLEAGRSVVEVVRSRDGAWIVARLAAGPSRDIVAKGPGPEGPVRPILASPDFDENAPALSPDGRWIAYTSDESGPPQVYVRPFPDVERGRWQLSSEPAVVPRWSADGAEIYFATQTGMMAAQVETEPTFRLTGVERLFTFPNSVLTSISSGWYDVTADGERFLLARPVGSDGGAAPAELILVLNFFEELKARLPR